jgi:Zn-dependent protease
VEGSLIDKLYAAVFVLVPMLLSLTVHEYSHARSAYLLGDDTAAAGGRMTLNPIAHIDWFGTILLPLLAVWFGGPFFGWAKPVPVNPLRFTRRIRMKTGMLITAAAGPASNLVMAFGVAVLFRVLALLEVPIAHDSPILTLLVAIFQINVVLAVFNLIPVPPLDGSRILVGVLPDSVLPFFLWLERNPIYVILAFVLLMSQAGTILQVPVRFLTDAILLVTGNA